MAEEDKPTLYHNIFELPEDDEEDEAGDDEENMDDGDMMDDEMDMAVDDEEEDVDEETGYDFYSPSNIVDTYSQAPDT